ncbi:MAG: tail protein X [Eubacteriales bacterium]|nr:tail protein X [Eubacteriales bacterium]
MATEYNTVSGDTFDSIAYILYGNEALADRIMKANMDKIDYFVFPSGIKLVIPDKDEIAGEISLSSVPEWRK